MKNLAGIVLAKEMNEKGDNYLIFNTKVDDAYFCGETKKVFSGDAYQCNTGVVYGKMEPSLLIYEDFVPRFTKSAFQEYYNLCKEMKDTGEFLRKHPEVTAELNRAKHYDGETTLYEVNEFHEEKESNFQDLEME